jgi:hypothetical protein
MRMVCCILFESISHCSQEFFFLLTQLSAGNWKGAAEVPKGTLEDAEKRLKGEEEKALFLGFVKKMLKWKPEERSSTKELLGDPWLNRV